MHSQDPEAVVVRTMINLHQLAEVGGDGVQEVVEEVEEVEAALLLRLAGEAA
tara:strand:- start:424 stop:579 length:156 start_codon:yes stop_codon:yes gene_type:complete